MLKRILMIGAAIASAGAAFGFARGRAEFRTWGIDPVEKGRAFPGDDLVPGAEAIDTRGLDLAAPPKDVWPWLVQMGYGRAGWYSYDQLDMNHPSADRIVPELQTLGVGDVMPTHPGGGFEVRILEPEQALVLYADRALMDAQKAAAPEGSEAASANVKATGMALEKTMQGEFQASWAFVLEPTASGGTRLIERFRGRMEVPETAPDSMRKNQKFAGNMLVFGLFVMVRRQMLGIRDRVEGRRIGKPWFTRAAPKATAANPTPA